MLRILPFISINTRYPAPKCTILYAFSGAGYVFGRSALVQALGIHTDVYTLRLDWLEGHGEANLKRLSFKQQDARRKTGAFIVGFNGAHQWRRCVAYAALPQ